MLPSNDNNVEFGWTRLKAGKHACITIRITITRWLAKGKGCGWVFLWQWPQQLHWPAEQFYTTDHSHKLRIPLTSMLQVSSASKVMGEYQCHLTHPQGISKATSQSNVILVRSKLKNKNCYNYCTFLFTRSNKYYGNKVKDRHFFMRALLSMGN